MPHYTYLLLGGGMTAASAIAGIREVDPTGTIGLLSADPHPPYDRPPLSKALWKEKDKPVDSIYRQLDPHNLTLHLGKTATHLNPAKKQITDDQVAAYTYDKLLLATGCSPRRLPFGNDHILYYRTLDDYRRLRAQTHTGTTFAVIGSGFIGTEIAAALAMNGKKVTLIFPDNSIGQKIYPKNLSAHLNSYYTEKGVELLPTTKVTNCTTTNNKPTLTLQSTTTIEREFDGIVAGIGVTPNTALAQAAGITIDNGIRVDSSLRTNLPDIYAAGDVASFHNPALSRWLRVEHEDNANTMGKAAGNAMAGKPTNYTHLPFFYSDLFDLGYEAVGTLDSRLQTFEDWKTPNTEGVIYYLQNQKVRGILLWGLFGQTDAARALIANPAPFTPENLKGRIHA